MAVGTPGLGQLCRWPAGCPDAPGQRPCECHTDRPGSDGFTPWPCPWDLGVLRVSCIRLSGPSVTDPPPSLPTMPPSACSLPLTCCCSGWPSAPLSEDSASASWCHSPSSESALVFPVWLREGCGFKAGGGGLAWTARGPGGRKYFSKDRKKSSFHLIGQEWVTWSFSRTNRVVSFKMLSVWA